MEGLRALSDDVVLSLGLHYRMFHVLQKAQRVTTQKVMAARVKLVLVVLTVEVLRWRRVRCTSQTQTLASSAHAAKVAGLDVWRSHVSRRVVNGKWLKGSAASSDVLMPATT